MLKISHIKWWINLLRIGHNLKSSRFNLKRHQLNLWGWFVRATVASRSYHIEMESDAFSQSTQLDIWMKWQTHFPEAWENSTNRLQFCDLQRAFDVKCQLKLSSRRIDWRQKFNNKKWLFCSLFNGFSVFSISACMCLCVLCILSVLIVNCSCIFSHLQFYAYSSLHFSCIQTNLHAGKF